MSVSAPLVMPLVSSMAVTINPIVPYMRHGIMKSDTCEQIASYNFVIHSLINPETTGILFLTA